MALMVEVVGMKAFKGFVNGEGINSGTVYARVKLDDRYNKPGENFKGGYAVEDWKMPDADAVFRMQHIPLPFVAELEVERVSNGKESREVVIGVRPVETLAQAPARPAAADAVAPAAARSDAPAQARQQAPAMKAAA